MAEETEEKKVWPSGYEEAVSIDDFEFIMTGKNDQPLTKFQKDKYKQYLTTTGQRMKSVPAGALPAGPADKEMYMVLESSGTWTFGGSSFVNFESQIMTLWWNKATYSVDGRAVLPDNKPKDWEPISYVLGKQVFSGGKIYESNASTLSTDVPGVSVKWDEKVGDDRVDKILENKSDKVEKIDLSKTSFYLDINGNLVSISNTAYKYTDFITVKVGDKIYGSGLAAANALILAFYTGSDISKTFVNGIVGTNTHKSFNYEVVADGYVALSFRQDGNQPIANATHLVKNGDSIYVTPKETSNLKQFTDTPIIRTNSEVLFLGNSFVSNVENPKSFPNDVNGEYRLVSKFPRYNELELFTVTDTARPCYGTSFSDGTNIYSCVLNSATFSIFKDGKVVKSQTILSLIGTAVTNVNFSSVGKIGDKLHILVSCYLLSSGSTGLFHYTCDANTFEIVFIEKINIIENAVGYSMNQVLFNGALYTAYTQSNTIINGALSNDPSALKIHIYKLDNASGRWVFQSTPAIVNEDWGSIWTPESLPLRRNTSPINPSVGVLFVNEINIELYYPNRSSILSIFIQKSADGINWVKSGITKTDTMPYWGMYPFKFKNRIYYATTAGFNSSTTSTVFSIFNSDFTKRINLTDPANALVNREVINHNDSLFLLESHISGPQIRSVVSRAINIEYYIGLLDGGFGRLIKENITPNEVPIAAKIGDYYTTSNEGIFNNFLGRNYFLGSASPTKEFIINYRNEQSRFVYVGAGMWQKNIISQVLCDQKSLIVDRIAPNNAFFTNATRIPVIAEIDKGVLISLFDVRYTVGEDYDEIDIGMSKSYNGGLNWVDNKIVMRRDRHDGWRIHDPSVVYDKVNKRIYVFGKQWEANKGNGSTAFWTANPQLCTFWVTYSDDQGSTWSQRENITNLKSSQAWHISSGASAGIQLINGTLVVPIYEVALNQENSSGFIYKTPGSNTWIKSVMTPATGNECQIAEGFNSELIMLQRSNGGNFKFLYRMIGGVTGSWSLINNDLVPEPTFGCNSSIVFYRGNYILACATAGTVNARRDIKVFKSKDFTSLEEVVQITDYTTMGYVCLAISIYNFGLIFEDTGVITSYKTLERYRSLIS